MAKTNRSIPPSLVVRKNKLHLHWGYIRVCERCGLKVHFSDALRIDVCPDCGYDHLAKVVGKWVPKERTSGWFSLDIFKVQGAWEIFKGYEGSEDS